MLRANNVEGLVARVTDRRSIEQQSNILAFLHSFNVLNRSSIFFLKDYKETNLSILIII